MKTKLILPWALLLSLLCILSHSMPAAAQPITSQTRQVMAPLFYWYDDEAGAHLRGDNGRPNITNFPPEFDAAFRAPGYSWKNPEWAKRELLDMADAGVDIALLVWFGHERPGSWNELGARNILQAALELQRTGTRPPKIGMFFDTSSFTFQEMERYPGKPYTLDLTIPENEDRFYEMMKNFWCVIADVPYEFGAPPGRALAQSPYVDVIARIDGFPVLVIYESGRGNFFSDWRHSLFDKSVARFESDFGTKPRLFPDYEWWYKNPHQRELPYDLNGGGYVRWRAAVYEPFAMNDPVALPRKGQDTIQFGPGYDDRLFPERTKNGSPVRSRDNGYFYCYGWQYAQRSGKTVAMVESWNELHEGTAIGHSHQYGRTYIDLTRRLSEEFRKRYDEADEVSCTLTATNEDGLTIINEEHGLYQVDGGVLRSSDQPYGQEETDYISDAPPSTDGRTVGDWIGGSRCRRTDLPVNGRMYFDVRDEFLSGTQQQKLNVSVEYFDNSAGQFRLIWNGGKSQPVRKTGSQTWRVESVSIPKSSFDNSLARNMNHMIYQKLGCDFAVDSMGDDDEYVRRVWVTRKAAVPAPAVEPSDRGAPQSFLVTLPAVVERGTTATLTVTALTNTGTTNTQFEGSVRFESLRQQDRLPWECTFTAADAGSTSLTAVLAVPGPNSIMVWDAADPARRGRTDFVVAASGSTGTCTWLPTDDPITTDLVLLNHPPSAAATGYATAAPNQPLLFNVSDDLWYKLGEFPTYTSLWITLEYLDCGYGSFQIIYDSNDEFDPPGGRKPARTQVVNLTGTGMWRSVRIFLEDPYFANRCMGGDFTVEAGGGRVGIRRVDVAPYAEGPTSRLIAYDLTSGAPHLAASCPQEDEPTTSTVPANMDGWELDPPPGTNSRVWILMLTAYLFLIALIMVSAATAIRRDRLPATPAAPRRVWLPHALSMVGLLAYIAAVYWPELTGQRYLQFYGDAVEVHLGWTSHLALCLRDGRLPFWNPFMNMGYPLASEMQWAPLYPTVFLPAVLLRDALPYSYLTYDALFHFAAGALCAYALAFSISRSHVGAVMAGIAWPFSGFIIARAGHMGMLHSFAWTPLLLLAIRHAVVRKSRGWTIIAAGVLWLILAAGHGQIFLFICWLAGFYGLWMSLSEALRVSRAAERSAFSQRLKLLLRESTSRLILLGCVFAFAALLGSHQILWMREIINQSSRQTLDLQLAGENPIHLQAMWTMAVGALRRLMPFDAYVMPLGGIILAAAMLSLLWLATSRSARFWWAAAIISLWLSLGIPGGLFPLVWKYVPGMNMVRFPERFAWVAQLAFTQLAAIGVAGLVASASSRRRLLTWCIAAAVVFLAVAGLTVALGHDMEAARPWRERIPSASLMRLLFGGSVTDTILNSHIIAFEKEMLREAGTMTVFAVSLTIVFIAGLAFSVPAATRPKAGRFTVYAIAWIAVLFAGCQVSLRLQTWFREPIPELMSRVRSDGTMRYRIAETWDGLNRPPGRVLSYKVPRLLFQQGPHPDGKSDHLSHLGMTERIPTVYGVVPFNHERLMSFMEFQRSLNRRGMELMRAQYFWAPSDTKTFTLQTSSTTPQRPWTPAHSSEYALWLGPEPHYLRQATWAGNALRRALPETSAPVTALCLAMSCSDYEDLDAFINGGHTEQAVLHVRGRRADTGGAYLTHRNVGTGPSFIEINSWQKHAHRLPMGTAVQIEDFPGVRGGYAPFSYASVIEFEEPITLESVTIESRGGARVLFRGLSALTTNGESVDVPLIEALGYDPFYRGKDFTVHRCDKQLPLLTWTGQWQDLHGLTREQRLARYFDPDHKPDQCALLERKKHPADFILHGDPATTASIQNIRRTSPGRLECSVETTSPGFLVFWEVCFDGWEVRVNGKKERLEKANHMYSAVKLAPGKHDVVFTYKVPKRAEAALLSIIGICGIGMLGLFRRNRSIGSST